MISIIGGGIAGTYLALKLSDKGYVVHLYEKRSHLLNSNPYCHLHYGLLYPDISLEDCLKLAQDSEKFKEEFPNAIQKKQTIILNADGFNSNLLEKAKLLNNLYPDFAIINNEYVIANEYQIIQEKVEEELLKRIEKSSITVHLNTEIASQKDGIWIDCTNTSDLMEQKTVFYFDFKLDYEIAVLNNRGYPGMVQITPLEHIVAVHVMDYKATLSSVITNNTIEYVISRVSEIIPEFSTAKYFTHKTCLQQLNNNVYNRLSTFTICNNVIKICLMKAISIISIADNVAEYLDKK